MQVGHRSARPFLPSQYAPLGLLAIVDAIALLAAFRNVEAAVFSLMMLSAVLVALAQQTLP